MYREATVIASYVACQIIRITPMYREATKKNYVDTLVERGNNPYVQGSNSKKGNEYETECGITPMYREATPDYNYIQLRHAE